MQLQSSVSHHLSGAPCWGELAAGKQGHYRYWVVWLLLQVLNVTPEAREEISSNLEPRGTRKSHSPKKFQSWNLEDHFAKGGLSALHSKEALKDPRSGLGRGQFEGWQLSITPSAPGLAPSCPPPRRLLASLGLERPHGAKGAADLLAAVGSACDSSPGASSRFSDEASVKNGA